MTTTQIDDLFGYPTIPDALPQIAGNGAMLLLSKPLIERNLDDVELYHGRDHEDDIVSVFSDEGLPGDLICWYLIVGEERDMLRLLCTVDLPVPQEKWGHALLLCNQHHRICRYGRCSLEIKEGQADAKLFFETLVDLTDGVTEDYLQRFIMLSLFAAHVFFERTHKEKLFIPARPRKRNKITRNKGVTQNK